MNNMPDITDLAYKITCIGYDWLEETGIRGIYFKYSEVGVGLSFHSTRRQQKLKYYLSLDLVLVCHIDNMDVTNDIMFYFISKKSEFLKSLLTYHI